MIVVARRLSGEEAPVRVEIPEGADLVQVLAKASGYGRQLTPEESDARWRDCLTWRAENAKRKAADAAEPGIAEPAHPFTDPRGRTGNVHRAETVGVRSTSIEAHRKLKESGKLTAQQSQVIAWVRLQPRPVTRGEIKRGTGLEINAVAGRVNELLHDFERPQLLEVAKQRCSVTGEVVNAVTLNRA